MKKFLLLLAVILCVLVLVPSCRKKNDGSENRTLVQSLISSESTSSLEPVVVVPRPEKAESRAEDKEVATAASSEVKKAEVTVETAAVEAAPVEEETVDIKSSAETSSTASEIIEVTAPSSEEHEEDVVAVETSLEEVPVDDGIYYDFSYSYNGYSSSIVIASTYTSLTIPGGVTADDIAAVAGMICQNYPEESSLITYSISGDTLTLNYPEQTKEYLYSILPVVEAQAKALIDMYPIVDEKDTAVESVSEERDEAALEKISEEIPVISPVAVVVEEEAVSEKGEFVKKWSIAAYSEPKFNLTEGSASQFVVGFGIRTEASITPSLAFGLKAQYDLSSYIQTSAYLKWTFISLGNFDFYLRSGVGGTFGVGTEKGQYALLVDAALGMNYNFTSNIALFTEFVGEWSIKDPGLELGASLGVKFTF